MLAYIGIMARCTRPGLSSAEITAIMRALGDPRRYDIAMQAAAADAPLPCCALAQVGQVSASTLSHHLQQLEQAGLIDVSRDGKFAILRFKRTRYEDFLRQIAAAADPPSSASTNAAIASLPTVRADAE